MPRSSTFRSRAISLDRYSDERLHRFRKKSQALELRALTAPGYQHPAKQMQKVRERAEALAAAGED